MLPDPQPDKLSVSAARQVASCALGLRGFAASVSPIPSSSRLAVSKTKVISCDGASHVTVRHKC